MFKPFLTNMPIKTRYIAALCLIALTVSSSALILNYVFKTQENDASIINIAGQQRMLSQRIALFITRLSYCPADNLALQDALLISIEQFQNNQLYLTTLDSLPLDVKALYFGPANLAKDSDTYAQQAKEFIASEQSCGQSPLQFTTTQSDSLLFRLNQVVQAFEAAASQRVLQVKQIEMFLWIFTLLLLLLEGLFIFRPMEMKIKRNLASLNKALRKAEEAEQQALQASKAKSEFLASMSHELRTPMNGLFGMIELAIDNPIKSNDYLKKAKSAGNQLLVLINDLLDLSKIEAGKLRIERAPFDLLQLIDDVSSIQSATCRLKNLDFIYAKKTDLPVRIIGDPTRIGQVMHNLLSNAAKFTAKGSVELRIGVYIQDKKSWLTIAVQDSGIGISADKIQHIFNKFEQADQSTTRLYGGTGLGLSIAHELTHLMQGSLTVESTEGEGSCFTFALPIEIDHTDSEDFAPQVKLHCAIVDDLQTSRDYLSHLTTSKGFYTETFSNANSFLNSNIKQFDVLILDLSMPNIDGVQLIEKLIARDITPLPHIILISAVIEHLDCSDKVRSLIWRTHAKPIHRRELESDLRELQNLHQRLDAENTELSSHHHILVVEDNEINAEVVKAILQSSGYHVSVATDGQKAVNACIFEKFDLILMDMQMPVMDGISATIKLRTELNFTQPIVALTANAFAEDRERCIKAGMVDLIAKPIDKVVLLSCIRKQLKINN
jgi:signal transduction histidine kinase/CheY-like chemotaxis protein